LPTTDAMRIAHEMQAQTLDSLHQGQQVAVATAQALYKTWAPVMYQFAPTAYRAGAFPSSHSKYIVDQAFDFGMQLLRTQREFAHWLIQATVPALHAIEKAPEESIEHVNKGSKPIQRQGKAGADQPRQRSRVDDTLGPEHSFAFRSPEGTFNACASSLASFARLANLVDDATWLYHLRRGDYSRWFEDVIQDEVLAHETALLEGPDGASAEDSRRHITWTIVQRYLTSD